MIENLWQRRFRDQLEGLLLKIVMMRPKPFACIEGRTAFVAWNGADHNPIASDRKRIPTEKRNEVKRNIRKGDQKVGEKMKTLQN